MKVKSWFVQGHDSLCERDLGCVFRQICTKESALKWKVVEKCVLDECCERRCEQIWQVSSELSPNRENLAAWRWLWWWAWTTRAGQRSACVTQADRVSPPNRQRKRIHVHESDLWFDQVVVGRNQVNCEPGRISRPCGDTVSWAFDRRVHLGHESFLQATAGKMLSL
jgi:hypothetical protein